MRARAGSGEWVLRVKFGEQGEVAVENLQTFTQYNSRNNQVSANIRFALLSTSSNGLFVVYNTRAVPIDYVDPHNRERTTLNRAFLEVHVPVRFLIREMHSA